MRGSIEEDLPADRALLVRKTPSCQEFAFATPAG
jgi:hypothetical protein